MSTNLCDTFQYLAVKTWKTMKSAKSHKFSLQEETITETLLLKLLELHSPKEIQIRAYTKQEEGRGTSETHKLPTGADYAFYFTAPSGLGIGLLIQAKKQFEDKKYRSLDSSKPQSDALIKYASANGYIPVYVFYNWDVDPTSHRSSHYASWIEDLACAKRHFRFSTKRSPTSKSPWPPAAIPHAWSPSLLSINNCDTSATTWPMSSISACSTT